MDRWKIVLLRSANCDLSTHNAQGHSSGFRGQAGDVAGGARWWMHCKSLFIHSSPSISVFTVNKVHFLIPLLLHHHVENWIKMFAGLPSLESPPTVSFPDYRSCNLSFITYTPLFPGLSSFPPCRPVMFLLSAPTCGLWVLRKGRGGL